MSAPVLREVRIDTDTPSFGVLLRSHRHRAKITLLELSRLAKCHEASICRLERGERDVSRSLAMALARGLHLDEGDADRFIASAGYCPPSIMALGWDSTLTAICRVLLDDTLPDDDLATFRAVIESLAAKWVPKHPDLRER